MSQSKARKLVGPGQLEPARAEDLPALKAGDALLRIHATSVNFHDLIGVDGGIPGLPLPRVPFSDASATVEAVAPDVKGFHVGDHVVPGFFWNWQDGEPTGHGLAVVLGDQVDGTLQTRLVVPARTLVRAPAELTHDEVATLGCAGLTAWRSVVEEGAIRPGQAVVLQGTGGVSLFALGFAKMLGARVIITSSSDAKLERARALGADVGINYRETPDWPEIVLSETAGEGADLVVEVGGGETLGSAIRATRVGGHVSIIGVLTGMRASHFPLAQVMSRNIALRGITVGSTRSLDAMCRAIDVSGYRPVVDRVFDLDNADQALEALRRQQHFGKLVIRVDP